jgi:hypothetical protein
MDPIETVGVASFPVEIVLTNQGHTNGAGGSLLYVLYQNSSTLTGVERMSIGNFVFIDPYSPVLNINYQLDSSSFTVDGDILRGSFHTGGSDSFQTQGFSQDDGTWLIGMGSDGGFCYGNQDPRNASNSCRVRGRMVLVGEILEPATLGLLGLSIAGLAYSRRRRH